MDAFRNAALAIASGVYDVALVLGFEKMRDGGYHRPNRIHPVIDNGERAPHIFALAANRYFKRHGASKATLAKVAVKNHHNGTLSPKAHLRMEINEETVLKAPLIYSPLGLFDCCPTTDGAAAAVLCRADRAKEFRPDPVYVKGVGLAVMSGQPYYKPTLRLRQLSRHAARRRGGVRAGRRRAPPTSTSPRCTTASPSPRSSTTRTSGSAAAARAPASSRRAARRSAARSRSTRAAASSRSAIPSAPPACA